ncbi:MAG: GNAT family N-acetyltransferase, partial [Bellilinea sp.]
SRLRHRLTPLLEEEGGHIGYDIRPSERGKGYATLLLALTLEKARESGMAGVLVTCDEDNIASARVIEKNKGQLLNTVVSQTSGKQVRRYWIDLKEA